MSSTQDDRERLLADAFVGLADSLVANYDVIDVLDRLVGYSVTLLAADAAGIMLVDSHDRLRVVASSCEESDWTELMQIQADALGCVVARPRMIETTALGAALLATRALGWTRAGGNAQAIERRFAPRRPRAERERAYAAWQRAVRAVRAVSRTPENPR